MSVYKYLLLISTLLISANANAEWKYKIQKDPFDKYPPLRLVFQSNNLDKGLIGFRRYERLDFIDMVIGLPEDDLLNPDKPIYIRIDKNAIQKLKAGDDNKLVAYHPDAYSRDDYLYYSIFHTTTVDGENSWKPNRLAIPVMDNFKNKDNFRIMGGGGRDFNPETDKHVAPDALFLKHLYDGNTLFLRYTNSNDEEVTKTYSLDGITPMLNKLVEKTSYEKCEDAISEKTMKNGCFNAALSKIPVTNTDIPETKKKIIENFENDTRECRIEARKQLPICEGITE